MKTVVTIKGTTPILSIVAPQINKLKDAASILKFKKLKN